MKKSLLTLSVLVAGLALAVGATAQMKQPRMVTLKGSIIDLTCASKAQAMTGMWANAKEDHMMPDGKTNKGCATMCLKGGQPAALFDGSQITAVFACNPRATLADYATQQVEVQGFWAGDGKEVKTFVPQKIRAGSGAWSDVDCATMH
ncbi:MAG: hypothetical protein ACE5JI_02275 [Acidobacteriota bacterium]